MAGSLGGLRQRQAGRPDHAELRARRRCACSRQHRHLEPAVARAYCAGVDAMHALFDGLVDDAADVPARQRAACPGRRRAPGAPLRLVRPPDRTAGGAGHGAGPGARAAESTADGRASWRSAWSTPAAPAGWSRWRAATCPGSRWWPSRSALRDLDDLAGNAEPGGGGRRGARPDEVTVFVELPYAARLGRAPSRWSRRPACTARSGPAASSRSCTPPPTSWPSSCRCWSRPICAFKATAGLHRGLAERVTQRARRDPAPARLPQPDDGGGRPDRRRRTAAAAELLRLDGSGADRAALPAGTSQRGSASGGGCAASAAAGSPTRSTTWSTLGLLEARRAVSWFEVAPGTLRSGSRSCRTGSSPPTADVRPTVGVARRAAR